MSGEKKPQNVGVMETLKLINDRTIAYLYEPNNPSVSAFLEKFEKNTNLKREQLAYAFLGLTAVYFIVGQFAQIIVNVVGFAYPAYQSVKAIRTPTTEDDTKWLTYWTVFAFFSLVDYFANWVLCYFPLYWLAKILFLLYLYLPYTNGAVLLYANFLDGFITSCENSFHNHQQKAK
ncbi:Receptor expression-enhancing protein [Aphelenchoides fujianensis]|nr:Receptor expression-enhancing protein [Aphelenchoides fujianensis]